MWTRGLEELMRMFLEHFARHAENKLIWANLAVVTFDGGRQNHVTSVAKEGIAIVRGRQLGLQRGAPLARRDGGR
jgi:hypothetical protein